MGANTDHHEQPDTSTLRPLIIWGLLVVFICLALYLAVELYIQSAKQRVRVSISDKYMLDIPKLLNNNWILSDDRETSTEITGWDSTIEGSRTRTYQFSTVDYVFITQTTTQYVDAISAQQAYPNELIWTFGDPSDWQDYGTEGVQLPKNDYRLACRELTSKDNSTQQSQCLGIFRYDRYLSKITIFPKLNGTVYISDAEIRQIISQIRDTLAS